MATKKSAAKAATSTKTTPGFDDIVADLGQIDERAKQFVGDVAGYMRDAAHTSLGLSLLVQDKLVEQAQENFGRVRTMIDDARDPKENLNRIMSVLDDAKAKGQTRADEFQTDMSKRLEPVTKRVEFTVPRPVGEMIDAGRQRLRDLAG